MPPELALLIFLCLVYFLFKVDKKNNPRVSNALLIPQLWFLSIIRPPLKWVNLVIPMGVQNTETNYIEGSPFDRNVYFLLIFIGALILFRRRINWSELIKLNKWLFLFVFYCFVSIAWSNYPFVCFKRWFQLVGEIIILLIVLTDHDPEEALKTLLRRTAYILIPLSVLFIKYFGYIGRYYSAHEGTVAYCGIASNKNSLGVICFVSGLFFIWSLTSLWKKRTIVGLNKEYVFSHILILLMVFWLLYMADSATALANLIIGITIIFLLELPFIRNQLGNFYILSVLLLISFFIVQSFFDIWTVVLTSLGRDATLTGRTDIWAMVLSVPNNPIFGAGYESFWLGANLEFLRQGYIAQLHQSHNGYIEIFVNLGYIGLALLICIILSSLMNAKTKLSFSDLGRLSIAFSLIVLLYNITEGVFKNKTTIWILFLLFCVIKTRTIPQTFKKIL